MSIALSNVNQKKILKKGKKRNPIMQLDLSSHYNQMQRKFQKQTMVSLQTLSMKCHEFKLQFLKWFQSYQFANCKNQLYGTFLSHFQNTFKLFSNCKTNVMVGFYLSQAFHQYQIYIFLNWFDASFKQYKIQLINKT